MKKLSYKNNFRPFLNDLSAKTPAPGGGSVSNLICCIGIALVQMSLGYSISNNSKIIRASLRKLERIKSALLPFIDLDSRLFIKAMKAKDRKRKAKIFKHLNKITFDLADNCIKILLINREVKGLIKKNIKSDFDIGQDLVRLALKAALKHLELNARFLEPKQAIKIKRYKTFFR